MSLGVSLLIIGTALASPVIDSSSMEFCFSVQSTALESLKLSLQADFDREDVGESRAFPGTRIIYYRGAEASQKFALRFNDAVQLEMRQGADWGLARTSFIQPRFVSPQTKVTASAVLTLDGELRISENHKIMDFKHASLVGGEDVLWAGMIQIENGQVVYLNNESGHYLPGRENLLYFLSWLESHGHDLEPVQVAPFINQASRTVSAHEFMRGQ